MTNLIEVLSTLLPILLLGMLLGAVFFWTMWFTVQRGLISHHPVRWFLGGLFLRMSIVLTGFYFIANGDWLTLLICLLGFVISREWVHRLVIRRDPNSDELKSEQLDAS